MQTKIKYGELQKATGLSRSYLSKVISTLNGQHLDETEDISVRLLSGTEVLEMLMADEMKQSLMAAPLWKYFALNP